MFGRKNHAPTKRRPDTSLEDLRDDTIALFLNSGLSQKQVHAKGGPTPQTITRWLYKETMFPRLDTVRATLRALGADLVVAPNSTVLEMTAPPIEERLGLSISIDRRPKMPPRPRKKARMIRQKARQRVDAG